MLSRTFKKFAIKFNAVLNILVLPSCVHDSFVLPRVTIVAGKADFKSCG